ncbi:MAG TPA: CDP-alcohol phosphatidyltransferase family protein [Gaiellaceae bacterium]|nr:CDP-alcohol phosphatidyltransferase family protein [Gaiellaceae bacterium]
MAEPRFDSLRRSRKPRCGTELLCEYVYRPLAQLVVLPLARLRVPPPFVAAAAGGAGLVAAVELARGQLLVAAALVQVKTVLDNADGQLARLTGRTTAFGRYLDSELDLVVNAALFAALAWSTGRPLTALAGFAALTAVLSVNFNVERLFRAEHSGVGEAMPSGGGRATAALRRVYTIVYAPQDRIVENAIAWRLRGRSRTERLAWNDPATVSLLANLGMSTQLAAFAAVIAVGRPSAFAWLAVAEVGAVAFLALRREARLRGPVPSEQEVA